jgi:serine/threonine protein kinase
MKSQSMQCDVELLEASLKEQLPEAQEDQLVEHLETCLKCQIRLEQMAAARNDWEKVSTALKSEAMNSSGSQPPEFSASHDIGLELDKWDTAADFAVHFLEPATKENAIGRLGDIDIFEVIGHGGMGIVLKGMQDELNRPVAVKVLVPHLASSGSARKRFSREAQAAAMIVHPNVMSIHAVQSSGTLPYLVMPYVSSESLQQRIDQVGPVSVVEILRFGLQIARGLASAHAQGLVHRDIKPANILLETGNDRVLITDFGLARAADDASLTRSGVIAGTPQFMSPEQARGDSVDCRSDLFSLGSVLYVLATGRPPFRAETSYGILRRITDHDSRPIRETNPEVPGWLCLVVKRLHAKQADNRFQSAEEVGDVLEQCLAHVQQPDHVLLPDIILSMVEREQTDSLNRPPNFSKAATHRVLLAFGVIVLGLVAWGVSQMNDRLEVNSAAQNKPIPRVDEPTSATKWDDGVDVELQTIDALTQELERQ